MALFRYGEVVATPASLAALEALPPETAGSLLKRHLSGDWGDMDAHDRAANDRALKHGGRLFSQYRIPNKSLTIWIITEADRSVTTILLPEEY